MPDFYTGKGDHGYTGILGKGRLPKYQTRLEAIGTIDEASAALAVARASCQVEKIVEIIITMQRDFCSIMSEIAASPENATKFTSIDHTKVAWLEDQIRLLGAQVEMPAKFIVPGDTQCGANLSFARAVIRRVRTPCSTPGTPTQTRESGNTALFQPSFIRPVRFGAI